MKRSAASLLGSLAILGSLVSGCSPVKTDLGVNNKTKQDLTLVGPDGKEFGVIKAGSIMAFPAVLTGSKTETYVFKDLTGKSYKEINVSPDQVKSSAGSPLTLVIK
jgi:hypothetical protein